MGPQSFTTLQDAIENQRIASTAMVASLNATDQYNFDLAAENYNLQMSIGQVTSDKLPVPVAPFAWVLVTMPSGFTFYEKSTTVRLTPKVPITTFNALDAAHAPANPPGIILPFGNPDGGGNWNANKADTWPMGVPTPLIPGPPDNQPHRYIKFNWAGFGAKYAML